MKSSIRFDWSIINQNINNQLSESEKQKILRILERYSLFELYHPQKEIVISCNNIIQPKSIILSGHSTWKTEFLKNVKTPTNLPRIDEHLTAERILHQIEIKFIDRLSGGMSSYYGFKGFFLSIILDLENESLIDAREEAAN